MSEPSEGPLVPEDQEKITELRFGDVVESAYGSKLGGDEEKRRGVILNVQNENNVHVAPFLSESEEIISPMTGGVKIKEILRILGNWDPEKVLESLRKGSELLEMEEIYEKYLPQYKEWSKQPPYSIE